MRVLTMTDGKREHISSPQNFVDLIDQYMGDDALSYYIEQIEALCSCAHSMCEYIDDLVYLKAEIEKMVAANGLP